MTTLRYAYLFGALKGYIFTTVLDCDTEKYREVLKRLGFTDEELEEDCWARKERLDD